jgi:hypothetical protein
MKANILTAISIVCFSTTATAKSDKAVTPAPLIELSGDNLVEIKVNGVPAKMLVDPSFPNIRAVNPDIATAAALKASMIGFQGRVGPISVMTKTDAAQIDYGITKSKDRVAWSAERKSSDSVDGIMGPSALPYERVRFLLGPTQAGERKVTFPMESNGFVGIGIATTLITVEGVEVAVRFTLAREMALATAPTGQLLARAFGGTLNGTTQQTHIQYGISRPVRGLVLTKPLLIGGRSINPIAVRISDFGDASTIADGETKADPDEIIVTAKSKKKQRHELTLGRAYLKGCSALTYDFKAKQIVLECV